MSQANRKAAHDEMPRGEMNQCAKNENNIKKACKIYNKAVYVHKKQKKHTYIKINIQLCIYNL